MVQHGIIHTATNYLRQCGNEVIVPENWDEFTVDVLYNLLCRNESAVKPLSVRAQEVVAEYLAKGRDSEIDHIPATEFCAPKSIDFTLPGLLPKRKQRQNTEFLLDPFYFSLEQYAKEHPMPRFSDCVVCFTQVYDQCLPTRRIRDYDNLEEKQLLDVLSTFVMADDTGLLCDAYNTAALGEKDCTRISVMEKKRFPAWLAEHENTLKSISDF